MADPRDPKLRRFFKRRFDEKQDIPVKAPGLLGNGVGTVETGTENRVYVRVNGVPTVAVCESVPHINELPVWVGYGLYDPTVLRILSQRIITAGDDKQTANGAHAETHRYFGSGIGGGTDVLWVDTRQILALRLFATTNTLEIGVFPGIVYIGGLPKLIGAKNTDGTYTAAVVELGALAVSTVDKCRVVLITINSSGTLVATGGSEVDISALDIETDTPEIPSGTRWVLGAVRMYYGQDTITEHRDNPDIIDMRFPMWHSHDGTELGLAVDDLSDVVITTIADGETLIYDSATSKYINKTLAEAGISAVGHTHTESEISDLSHDVVSIDGITVDIDGADAGDLVTIHRMTAVKGSNIATLAAGATVAGISVYSGNVANNAIDGNDATFWAGASNPVADDWFSVDFGAVKNLYGWKLYQFPYTGMWGATQYKVQLSANGTDWADIVTHDVAADSETVDFATIQSTRYLRFYVVNGGGNSWQIYTLEVYEADNYNVPEIIRLPISATDGDVLTVDGGAPVWAAPTGGSATSIDGITVDLTGITDGQTMVYDLANTKLIAGDAGASLTVEEADGTPSVANVSKIKVTNGTLTDDGGGVLTLDFGSAATDGSAIHDNEAGEIHAITEDTTPADDDEIITEKASDSYSKRRVKISNLPTGGVGGGADILEVQVFS